MRAVDWVQGDLLGLEIPAQATALAAEGDAFLTRAFRAAGAIAPDNRVIGITRLEECDGGSTGSKLLLDVEYQTPAPDLHEQLFVKFSRNFVDEIRDRARFQMEREVHFALLSRHPDFPIAVPACYFSDFHHDSGTGILITRRIPFGSGGIEPHYQKCLDYSMPDPLQHYRALVGALGRLAGTHRAGQLPATVEQHFPFDEDRLAVSQRTPYTREQIEKRVARYRDFAARFPQLLPDNIRSGEFLGRLAQEAPRFTELLPAARHLLHSRPDLIALCHWNANVDNAWFWRAANGELECGLLDWGHVSQMNIAMAFWGCMSGAETELWNRHLDELLDHFAATFSDAGGMALDIDDITLHLQLHVARMGLAWLLDTPALLRARIADLEQVESRFDPRLRDDELARASLQMMTTFLNLWETRDMQGVLSLLAKRWPQ